MAFDRAQFSLPWLVRLRWRIVAGQAVAVLLADRVLAIDLSLPRVLLWIAAAGVTNLALASRHSARRTDAKLLCAAALCFDVGVLTAILHASGGPTNPFSVLYLVYITLAALLLGPTWTWSLTALSVLAYGGLFLVDVSGPHAGHGEHAMHMGEAFAGHLRGMWIAFTLTATLTAGAVLRLTAAIDKRDREIETIRLQAARSERLAALTTLAAGAAHELGTPLATIAVAASELERNLARLPAADRRDLVEDAQLIRSQLQRCRQILDQMSAAAGEFSGEAPSPLPLADLLDQVRCELPAHEASRLVLDRASGKLAVVPHRAFKRALVSLLRNAFDASGPDDQVRLEAETADDGGLRVSVVDHGHGMTDEVLERATEPFFTTKPTGKGMGMGLFLARALVEQLGGQLRLTSAPGSGTTAVLELPPSVLLERGGRPSR